MSAANTGATEKPPDPNAKALTVNQGQRENKDCKGVILHHSRLVKQWFAHAEWLRRRSAFKAWGRVIIATRIEIRRDELRRRAK